MLLATKNAFVFEPKMKVIADVAGETVTPQPLRPTLGPVAALRYKPATFAYLLKADQAPTDGQVIVKVRAAGSILAQVTHEISGVTSVSGNLALDLTDVGGQTEISTAIEMTTPTDAGIVITADSVLYVEQPVTVNGC